MILRKAYKYRIYPTKAQQTNLKNQFSMCRYVYNWSLKERMDVYEQEGRSVSWYEQKRQLPLLKKARPWFKGVHSQVLQDVLRRLDNAFDAFFRRVKQGDVPGFPKFKKRGRWSSITYPQYTQRPSDSFYVPKVGNMKCVYHRPIPEEATIKTLTILQDGGKWFASFSTELEVSVEPKDALPPLAIDLGLNDYVYASNGFHCVYPKAFRKSQQRLKRLQRRFAKAPKRSPQWYKLLKAIQKTHYRVKCQRLDFLHKTANALLKQTDYLIHENLNIRNMLRRPKAKQDDTGTYLPNGACHTSGLHLSISDAAWGLFLNIVAYKVKEQGKRRIPTNPRGSSQVCVCGEPVRKTLSQRVHECPKCGLVENRDYVSSLVLLRRGLATLAASAA
jgi:putative transposase